MGIVWGILSGWSVVWGVLRRWDVIWGVLHGWAVIHDTWAGRRVVRETRAGREVVWETRAGGSVVREILRGRAHRRHRLHLLVIHRFLRRKMLKRGLRLPSTLPSPHNNDDRDDGANHNDTTNSTYITRSRTKTDIPVNH